MCISSYCYNAGLTRVQRPAHGLIPEHVIRRSSPPNGLCQTTAPHPMSFCVLLSLVCRQLHFVFPFCIPKHRNQPSPWLPTSPVASFPPRPAAWRTRASRMSRSATPRPWCVPFFFPLVIQLSRRTLGNHDPISATTTESDSIGDDSIGFRKDGRAS